jgi:8-oxo-dGTP pyrophosphatase MutT (NUDIX family)
MRREVFEETGLAVLSAELLYEGELREECRRGSDYHLWQAWCCEAIGEPCISEEADVVGWYSRLEIMEELPLILPAGVFFEKLFGERPRRVRAG